MKQPERNYNTNRKGVLQYLGIPHHEYWSWWWFSIPTWPWWIAYAIRLRNPTWFTAVNPGIEHSGYTEESKYSILGMIPVEVVPKTIYVRPEDDLPSPILALPYIVKPDIGGRGRKVKIIQKTEELSTYHQEVGEPYLIQELIAYPVELGIFYARIPSESKGRILSVTEKKFLEVVGDGKSTLRELLHQSKRGRDQIERLEQEQSLNTIVPRDQTMMVEPIGNHCRGTQFINRQDLINEELVAVFDSLTNRMNGFYYGRFDLRVKSLEDLYQGKNIAVLELNGLTSMDTHLFDPHFKLRDVLPVLIRNCTICYKIARENLQRGVKPTHLSLILKKSLAFFKP
jgi:hypothetical protein